MKSITEAQAKNLEKSKLITLANKPGQFYLLAESLEDRYDERPTGVLDKITLSQFSKRCTLATNTKAKNEDGGKSDKKAINLDQQFPGVLQNEIKDKCCYCF